VLDIGWAVVAMKHPSGVIILQLVRCWYEISGATERSGR
jgi:hypothetical protein